MIAHLKSLLVGFRSVLQDRMGLLLEGFALRHQIIILKRSASRPNFNSFDRLIWIILATVWPDWKQGLEIIQPETVKRWRKRGWRAILFGKYRKNHGGRPPVEKEIRDLIKRMAFENFLWGAPRIHGELLKLGYQVGEATVSRYLARFFPGWRYLTWRVFFRNQLASFGGIPIGNGLSVRIRNFSGFLAGILPRSSDKPVGTEIVTVTVTPAFANGPSANWESLPVQNLSTIRIRGSPLVIVHHETTPTSHLPPTLPVHWLDSCCQK